MGPASSGNVLARAGHGERHNASRPAFEYKRGGGWNALIVLGRAIGSVVPAKCLGCHRSPGRRAGLKFPAHTPMTALAHRDERRDQCECERGAYGK
jgi:hypothetical protein